MLDILVDINIIVSIVNCDYITYLMTEVTYELR